MATNDNPEINFIQEWISTLPNKRIRSIRLISQTLFFVLFNGVIFGLSRISFPVPVSLPTGSPYATAWAGFDALQYITSQGQFPFLVVGVFFLTGAIFGRMTCGWACPIGFWQDLIALIPLSKTKVSKPLNKELEGIASTIVTICLLIVAFFGIRRATEDVFVDNFLTFIPYGIIDPAATMFVTLFYAFLWGVIPGSENQSFLDTVGILFLIKVVVLILITYVSIKVPRAYCRWICPTGAVLGFISSQSILTIKRDATKCVDGCAACEKACPTGVPITEENTEGIANSLCILCGDCVDACPDAMSFGFRY